jgi:hypothetical protein
VMIEDFSGPWQSIGLHDIQFTKVRPISDQYTLDWDGVDWCRSDRFWLTAGEVNAAVSFSGDAVQAARRSETPGASSRAGRLPTETTDLTWRVEWRGLHQAAVLTVDFDRPVREVSLTVHGHAAQASGIADELMVVGFRGGRPVKVPRLDLSAGGQRREREVFPSLSAAGVRPSSADGCARGDVRFRDTVDRIVLHRFPNASVATGHEAARKPASPTNAVSRFSYQSQISLGTIRFLPAELQSESESPGRTAKRVVVPATADPWTAGLEWGHLAEHEIPTSQRAQRVEGLELKDGDSLNFAVSGAVREQAGIIERTADGGPLAPYLGDPRLGICGASIPVGSLTGVFVGQRMVEGASVRFTSDRFVSALSQTTIAPALDEVFFIGDGKCPNGKGLICVVRAKPGQC